MLPQQAKRRGKRPAPEEGEASRPRPSSIGSEGRGRFTRLSLTLDISYRRLSILAAIIPKASMTIGLPIAFPTMGRSAREGGRSPRPGFAQF
jgi:hypothetical protein